MGNYIKLTIMGASLVARGAAATAVSTAIAPAVAVGVVCVGVGAGIYLAKGNKK